MRSLLIYTLVLIIGGEMYLKLTGKAAEHLVFLSSLLVALTIRNKYCWLYLFAAASYGLYEVTFGNRLCSDTCQQLTELTGCLESYLSNQQSKSIILERGFRLLPLLFYLGTIAFVMSAKTRKTCGVFT